MTNICAFCMRVAIGEGRLPLSNTSSNVEVRVWVKVCSLHKDDVVDFHE